MAFIHTYKSFILIWILSIWGITAGWAQIPIEFDDCEVILSGEVKTPLRADPRGYVQGGFFSLDRGWKHNPNEGI